MHVQFSLYTLIQIGNVFLWGGEEKMKTSDPLIKANTVSGVKCLENCVCVVFLTLDSCNMSDGQKWQKWLVVTEVVALISHAPRLSRATGWHDPCGADGNAHHEEHVSLQQAQVKDSNLSRSVNDEWPPTVCMQLELPCSSQHLYWYLTHCKGRISYQSRNNLKSWR